MAELVSVVVPVYNGGRFLATCIDSLLAQGHPAVEIVVVDDGSSDGSAAIARRLGARVIQRPHEGLAPTRNAGIEASTGTLVGFCDADDRWKPHKARLQAAYLASHPETAVVLCRHETSFEPGVAAPDWLLPDQVRGDLDGVSPTSGLFRREALERLGGFKSDIETNGTDFNLLIRARTAGLGIALLEEQLLVRRIHDDNMTTREGAAKAAMLQTVREHLRAKS